MVYRICGVALRSNIPLPELPPYVNGTPYGEFHLSDREAGAGEPVWLHRWVSPGGDLLFSAARHPAGYLLRFREGADFVVDADGRRILGHAAAGLRADTLRHLLLDHVLPLALSRRHLVLHAAGVSTGWGAVAFLAVSGGGKSTLTGSFAAAGMPHLGDDFLRVERTPAGAVAVPAYPSLRLFDDSLSAVAGRSLAVSPVTEFTTKKRVHAGRALPFCDRPVRLRAAYVLAPLDNGAATAITSLSPRVSAVMLLNHAFRLDIGDRAALVREMDDIAALVGGLPVFQLAYPRSFTHLAAVREAVVDHLRRVVLEHPSC